VTYRTEQERRRLIYTGAALAVLIIAALAIVGADNNRALDTCSAPRDVCLYTLR
jgi:hypothetical protein